MSTVENLNEKRRLTSFIKRKYPVGSFVFDKSFAEPYQINSNSVFDVVIEDLKDGIKPFTFNESLSFVDFYVHDNEKDSPRYFIKTMRKDLCLEN